MVLLKAVLVRVTHMGYEGRKQIFYYDWPPPTRLYNYLKVVISLAS